MKHSFSGLILTSLGIDTLEAITLLMPASAIMIVSMLLAGYAKYIAIYGTELTRLQAMLLDASINTARSWRVPFLSLPSSATLYFGKSLHRVVLHSSPASTASVYPTDHFHFSSKPTKPHALAPPDYLVHGVEKALMLTSRV